MAKRIRDTDYLSISTRVRAMETGLLSRDKMEQILEARSREDIAKILQEAGYPDLDPERPEEMDAALARIREEKLLDLSDGAPDPALFDIFKIPYDYHNIKAILKADAMGMDPARMLSDLGRVPAREIREAVQSGAYDSLPGKLPIAIAEAKEALDTTRDPQICDIIADRWSFEDLYQSAEQSGSAFLLNYIKIRVDAVNLKALIRTLRMGKNADFLRGVLMDGGEIDVNSILNISANGGNNILDLYNPTAFKQAAEVGADALKSGGALTEFEKLCDDAVTDYLNQSSLIPFGEAPVIAYLAARETEYANLRILLMGRNAGLSPEIIKSRLRAV